MTVLFSELIFWKNLQIGFNVGKLFGYILIVFKHFIYYAGKMIKSKDLLELLHKRIRYELKVCKIKFFGCNGKTVNFFRIH